MYGNLIPGCDLSCQPSKLMGVSDRSSADVPSVFLKMVLGSFEIKDLGRKRGLRKEIEKKNLTYGRGKGIRKEESRRSICGEATCQNKVIAALEL